MKRSRCNRSNQGSIFLVLCVTGVLCVLAIAALFAVTYLTGARKFQDVTDSAALSVAKRQIQLAVPLNAGLEKDNFSTLMRGSNETVDLLTYNRIVGQLLLVSLNAQAERNDGSISALSHANQLWYAVEGSKQSIGRRLSDRLANASYASSPFQEMVNLSNFNMLPGSNPDFRKSQYKVSYMHAGDCTNVFVNEAQIPSGAELSPDALSRPKGADGHRYIRGYTGINVGNAFSIQGTPIMPGCAPHLVSQRAFNAHTTAPTTTGFVPPNSFQSSALLDPSKPSLAFTSCAMVGSLQRSYPASIPGGFIEINKTGNEPATVLELINRAGLNATESIVPQLLQRAREIQPDLADDSFIDLLSQEKIKTSKAYLTSNEANGQIELQSQPPASYVAGTSPDGTDKKFGSDLIASADFTPSSGFNNLLGVLTVHSAPAGKEQGTEDKQKAQKEGERLKAIAEELKAKAESQKAQSEEKRATSEAQQSRVEAAKAQMELNAAKASEREGKAQLLKANAALAKAEADHNKKAELAAELQKRLAQAAIARAEKEGQLAETIKDKAAAENRLSQADQKRALADLRLAEAEKQMANLESHLAQASAAQANAAPTSQPNGKTQSNDTAHTQVAKPIHLTVNVPGSNQQSEPSQTNSLGNTVANQEDRTRTIEDSAPSPTPTLVVQNYKWN